jgi:hypothetical protein
MRLIVGAVIVFVLLAPLRVAAQGMGWDGRPVQPLPPAQGYAPGYAISPQAMFLYEEEKKSPGIALLLSLLLPGLGNIYADHPVGAVITWALIIGGVSIAVYGIQHVNPEGGGGDGVGMFFLGWVVALGGVVYSLVDSYQSAKEYNHELARRLGLPFVGVAPIRMTGGETAWGPALVLRF